MSVGKGVDLRCCICCRALALLALLAAPALAGYCPRDCRCGLDRKGRRAVNCYRGDGKDPMPMPLARDNIEVFEVAPPANKPNYYTIGPIFQGHREVRAGLQLSSK